MEATDSTPGRAASRPDLSDDTTRDASCAACGADVDEVGELELCARCADRADLDVHDLGDSLAWQAFVG